MSSNRCEKCGHTNCPNCDDTSVSFKVSTTKSMNTFYWICCKCGKRIMGGDPYQKHFNWGVDFFRKGQYNLAISEFKKSLEYNSQSVKVLHNLGLAFFISGQNENAKEFFKKALELESNIDLKISLGAVYIKDHDYEKAIELFEDAIKENPNNAKAQLNLGNAFYLRDKEGDYIRAIEKYRKVLDLIPDHLDARISLGKSLINIGDFDKAISEIREIIKKEPDNYEAHIYLGIANAKKGDIEKAIQEFNIALQITPKNPSIYFNLGDAYQISGKSQKAIEMYKKYIKLAKLRKPINTIAIKLAKSIIKEIKKRGKVAIDYKLFINR